MAAGQSPSRSVAFDLSRLGLPPCVTSTGRLGHSAWWSRAYLLLVLTHSDFSDPRLCLVSSRLQSTDEFYANPRTGDCSWEPPTGALVCVFLSLVHTGCLLTFITLLFFFSSAVSRYPTKASGGSSATSRRTGRSTTSRPRPKPRPGLVLKGSSSPSA